MYTNKSNDKDEILNICKYIHIRKFYTHVHMYKQIQLVIVVELDKHMYTYIHICVLSFKVCIRNKYGEAQTQRRTNDIIK